MLLVYIHFAFVFLILLNIYFLILSNNPVYAVLFLILIFFCSSGILILFEIEFLGLLFMIIYVGAIAVLFLFIVMMLDLKNSSKIYLSKFYNILFILFSFIVFSLIYFSNFLLFFDKYLILENSTILFLDSLSNISVFGQCLYNYYIFCFVIAGLVLLVSMLGAISLTLVYTSRRKVESISRQLSRSNIFLSYFK
jgi:NADH-quinone oxidoreductase subunit J